jgi:hypothetical protein
MQAEIVEMVGAAVYAKLVDFLAIRGEHQYLPHPALKRKAAEVER